MNEGKKRSYQVLFIWQLVDLILIFQNANN